MNEVDNRERLDYFLLGCMLGSDPKFLSGTGSVSNKIIRMELDGDNLIRRTYDKEDDK